MKRLALALILCLCCLQSEARMSLSVVGGSVPVAAANCMTGTYLFAWDGDWSGDTDKACAGSGDTTGVDASTVGSPDIGTDYGESGSVGIKSNAVNEYFLYTQTGNQYTDWSSAQTIWVRLYISVAPTGDTTFFQTWNSTNTNDKIVMSVKSTREIVCTIRDQSGDVIVNAYGDVAISAATWTDIGYTYDRPNQDHSVNADGTWDDDLNEITADLDSQFDKIAFGSPFLFNMGAGEYILVDRIAVVSGYKADKPSGW